MSVIHFLLVKCCLLISCITIESVTANTFLWSNSNSNHNHNQDTPQWQRASIQNTAICVDIPVNLTLCHGIGYTKMRLPNLLNHDTLQEVSQQATSWVPLYQLNCHPNTQLFLCSLFSPVCLDHPIPPCRSLCQSVQASCEQIMLNYGYPWPKIVQCDQFPIDNDMCIMAQHSSQSSPQQSLTDKERVSGNGNKQRKRKNQSKKQRRYNSLSSDMPSMPAGAKQETVYEPQPHLQVSSQLDAETKLRQEPQVDQVIDYSISVSNTSSNSNSNNNEPHVTQQSRKWNKDQRQLYNDIIGQYCRSQWMIKARIHPPNAQKMQIKVRKYFLIHGTVMQKHSPLTINSTILEAIQQQSSGTSAHSQKPAQDDDPQAQQIQARKRYLILGRTENGENVVTYAMQWPHKSAQLRKAIKTIKQGNYVCADGNTNAESKENSDTKTDNNEEPTRDNSQPLSQSSNSQTKRTRKEPKNRSHKSRQRGEDKE